MNLEEAINQFYVKTDQLGFKYLCTTHNHLSNKDEYMKVHLFKEHDISLPFKNWEVWFTLFSVGDSYSSSYRCNICDFEYLLEKDAKKHILLDHNVKVESLNNPKKIKVDYFNGIETEKLVLVFDHEKECDHCNEKGSYVIESDPIIGLCYPVVQVQYSNIEEEK